MSAVYTTREVVKSAVDVKDTARADAQIDRLIEDASRSIDRLCHREFFPWTGTRYFEWPHVQSPTGWRIWLGRDELAELTAATAGGVALSLPDLLLEPVNAGPPYNRVELDRSSESSFDAGNTPQRNLALTGVFAGAPVDEAPAGALAEALDDSEPAIDVTDSSAIGVGSLLRCDDERMIVTGKSPLDSGVNVATTALTAKANNTAVILSTTTGAPVAGEVVLIGAEKMLVTDVAGTTMAVLRAYDGSVLAEHAIGADVYVYRTLTVRRGVLGTTAATHLTAAPLVRWVPPGPVEGLCVAKVLTAISQEGSAYARVVGSGDNQREARGAGLAQKTAEVYASYGRKARTGAV